MADARESDRSVQTRRPTVQALEELLGHAHPVLDHGFLRVIDYMGDDGRWSRRRASPTGAARGARPRTRA